MLTEDGGELLREFTEKNYQEQITKAAPGLWHVLGVGHSNAIFIEGSDGVILIDTLDTLERGERLADIIKQETGKEVKTILFTHGHPDHRGGAGAFLKSQPEIIAFAPKTPPLQRTELLKDIQNIRGARQFGYSLSDQENISQGIGIREGAAYGETPVFAAPTTVYQEERVIREIDGITLELVRVPGETDDQILVWIPEKEALCCGDNYYACWPNLYAIRGSQYRDIATWIHSLETILSYPAQILLPGHTLPLFGKEQIQEILGNFKDAIDFVLTETLKGMNEGKTIDQLAHEVRLPEKYTNLPYLGEFYGSVDWTVRAIYTAYLGWFDGNPTRLHPLSPRQHAEKMAAAMGGREQVWKNAQQALISGEYQWCMELCDLLFDLEGNTPLVCLQKADALEKLAEYETSANGRHYYICCAKELRKAAGQHQG